MTEIFGFNAYSPKEIAERVETVGVAKARLSLLSMIMLGVLAGVFIGLGALFFVLIKSDSTLGLLSARLLAAWLFIGLILVIVAGAVC
jgi:formate/nitrite transporter FocA (FNT family)